ncbi:MAG: hypothetical protein AB7G47_19840 [Mycolicibacterium sp.]|uniref:hypothetical protein n=1 Tax=Mycolicibacterium sp. TaxID=2320850 RepID=UPI003D14A8AF
MWTAQLSYDAPGLDLERRLAIVDALDANAAYDESTGRLTLTFEVDGATLRQAADTALREGSHAVSAAALGLMPTRPTQIRVLSSEDFVTEAERPGAVEQMGVAEIAALLGVTRQRVNQLIATDAFPAPVSRLAAGPVFTTASVEAFKKRWEPSRKSGRPWHKTKTKTTEAGPEQRSATSTRRKTRARH